MFLPMSRRIPSRAEGLESSTSVWPKVTAMLSGLVGLANLVVGVYLYCTAPLALTQEDLLYLLVQGVAWITIAISLRIRYTTYLGHHMKLRTTNYFCLTWKY